MPICSYGSFTSYAPVGQRWLLYSMLLASRLDYCNAFYMGLPLETTWKLQLVQKAAATLPDAVAFRTYMNHVLKQLHWLPVHFRAQFKVLMLAFKALNGIGPNSWKTDSSLQTPSLLRSAEGALLVAPPPSEAQGWWCWPGRGDSPCPPLCCGTVSQERYTCQPHHTAFREYGRCTCLLWTLTPEMCVTVCLLDVKKLLIFYIYNE